MLLSLVRNPQPAGLDQQYTLDLQSRGGGSRGQRQNGGAPQGAARGGQQGGRNEMHGSGNAVEDRRVRRAAAAAERAAERRELSEQQLQHMRGSAARPDGPDVLPALGAPRKEDGQIKEVELDDEPGCA